MEELSSIRTNIDRIDREILELFRQRMDEAAKVAAYKQEQGLPVLDAAREREKIEAAMDAVPDELRGKAARLMELLMELSRERQNELLEAPGGQDLI